jgi:hypothetical protein
MFCGTGPLVISIGLCRYIRMTPTNTPTYPDFLTSFGLSICTRSNWRLCRSKMGVLDIFRSVSEYIGRILLHRRVTVAILGSGVQSI